jgi:hypothetical protein
MLRSAIMPHRRNIEKGSFGGHFDELVKHFPGDRPAKATESGGGPAKDGRSIHALLFERASKSEPEGGGGED